MKNVKSFDFTSSYPYVMTTCKFPAIAFKKCNLKRVEDMLESFAYIVVVKFKNLSCKYYNTFISKSKCNSFYNGRLDNGRIIKADELEIVLTDIDFKFILQTYNCEYEIIESYYSIYDYLPKDYIEFILEKYVEKTKYKGVAGKELLYNLTKQKFNSLYGMTVTNNIKDEIIFDNDKGWYEVPLTNDEILKKLKYEKKQAFLSFSYGVWTTAWARFNLLSNVIQLDEYAIYMDTDSIKVRKGFDKSVIDKYNQSVFEKIKKASEDLEIPIEKYMPKDIKGNTRTLGVFDEDGEYQEFITQGAKKYAYKDDHGKIHITVAGVPKEGAKALKTLEDFKDDLVFDFKDTNKNLIIYADEMEPFILTDYKGKSYTVTDKFGCCLLPTTYVLGKSLEYAELISDHSSDRAIFIEGDE